MAIWNQFPTTNFHEMDFQWLLEEVKKSKDFNDETAKKLTSLDDEITSLVEATLAEWKTDGTFTGLVASVLENAFINVKLPPEGIAAMMGDGVTDDAAALRALLQYADEKAKTLFFPDGIYNIASTVNWTPTNGLSLYALSNDNVVIRAVGSSKLILKVDDGLSFNASNITFSSNNLADSRAIEIETSGNVQLSNVNIIGDVGKSTIISGKTIRLDSVNFANIILDGIVMGDFSYATCDLKGSDGLMDIRGGAMTLTGSNNMISGRGTVANDGEGNILDVDGVINRSSAVIARVESTNIATADITADSMGADNATIDNATIANATITAETVGDATIANATIANVTITNATLTDAIALPASEGIDGGIGEGIKLADGRHLLTSFSPSITVELPYIKASDYGVTPTNSAEANDSGMSVLISVLTARGGGVVYFAVGTYAFSTAFTLPINVSFIADGNTVFDFSNIETNAIQIGENNVVKGIGFTASGITTAIYYISAANNDLIEDCYFNAATNVSGIFANSGYNVTITDNTFTTLKSIVGALTNSLISDNYFNVESASNDNACINLSRCVNCTITSNNMIASTGIRGIVLTGNVTDSNITNNAINKATQGIYVSASTLRDVLVSNNNIIGSAAGVSGSAFFGIQITYSGSSEGQNVIVANNLIRNMGNSALYISGGSGAILYDVIINGNSTRQNHCLSAPTNQFNFNYMTGLVISGNSFGSEANKATGYVFAFNTDNQVTLMGNNIVKPTNATLHSTLNSTANSGNANNTTRNY